MEIPVPEDLLGCWRRESIRLADGTVDDTSQVYWLQHPTAMVDVRIPADQPPANGRTAFDDFVLDELLLLAGADASCGRTACTPIEVDGEGVRRATARWLTRNQLPGRALPAYHPVTAYPEPGLLAWEGDGSVLLETAPSGAYVERWTLVPGSRSELHDETGPDGVRWFRTGPVAVLVRDRPVPLPRPARLGDLLQGCGRDRRLMHDLLDCEFSVAEVSDGAWRIVASTLPWRTGAVLDDRPVPGAGPGPGPAGGGR